MTDDRELSTQVAQKLKFIRELPLVVRILNRLRGELSPAYTYHSVLHTEDVLREVVLFSAAAGITDRRCDLLGLAAAFHDAGFLTRALDNEPLAAEMAAEAMRAERGFSEQEIGLVHSMILDTRLISTSAGLKQQASQELSKYLLDADLSNLGREDFFEKLELRHKEIGTARQPFLEDTLQFIEAHQWQTEVAARIREETKRSNISQLRRMIAALG